MSKIELKWNAKTTNASSQLDIYGKSSAYSAATELYNTTSAGTLLKSAINGTTTIDLSNESDTAYIGLRSKSGALYLDSIKITWVSDSEETTYDISFNANGGKFANGEGVKITKNVGEKKALIYQSIIQLHHILMPSLVVGQMVKILMHQLTL